LFREEERKEEANEEYLSTVVIDQCCCYDATSMYICSTERILYTVLFVYVYNM